MNPKFYILMGVSGCGKTAVGKILAHQLGWDFYDADDFHPTENILKMAQGIPLTDTDRAAWLASLHALISFSLRTDKPGVLACSALKEAYRQKLMDGNDGLQFVYLKGSYELIWSRMVERREHYMKPHMLESQFKTLEEPTNALTLDISMSVDDIVQEILRHMQ